MNPPPLLSFQLICSDDNMTTRTRTKPEILSSQAFSSLSYINFPVNSLDIVLKCVNFLGHSCTGWGAEEYSRFQKVLASHAAYLSSSLSLNFSQKNQNKQIFFYYFRQNALVLLDTRPLLLEILYLSFKLYIVVEVMVHVDIYIVHF